VVDSAGMELSATVTRRLPAASVLAALLCALTLLASAPSPSASNLKTRVWDFFEDCPLCTDGEGDLSRQSSSGKTASNASDCGWRNLFYNRFRYYDPAGGRYFSPDPIGLLGGFNQFKCGPNTTGWIDPYGLAKKKKKGSGCDGTPESAIQNRTPSPALKGSPYHPDTVGARVRPDYRPNPAHDRNSPHFNVRKTPEPPDAEVVYADAVRADTGTWYGQGEGGWYRYSSDNAGGVHFSGTIQEGHVPIDARRALRE